jgi:hypothetical protein
VHTRQIGADDRDVHAGLAGGGVRQGLVAPLEPAQRSGARQAPDGALHGHGDAVPVNPLPAGVR